VEDDLYELQQAILMAHPPPTNTVTLPHTYITIAMSMGSSIWRTAIRNACNDDHLPHPLYSNTTIFNIHHNLHYTTLIATDISDYYYDPLQYPTPPPQHIFIARYKTGTKTCPHLPSLQPITR
jgi:hypothetical protein